MDFQISTFSPSNVDLLYATTMLYDAEMRLKKRHFFSHYYFESFLKTLQKIGFEGELPKYSDFKIADLKYRSFSKFF